MILKCEIWGAQRGAAEDCILLGPDVVSLGEFQRFDVSNDCSNVAFGVKQTRLSRHFERSRNVRPSIQRHNPKILTFSYPFKDEAQTALFKDPVRIAL